MREIRPLNAPKVEVKISDKRKALFFRVMDGHHNLIGTMHILHHYVHCDYFLQWLIDNDMTGKNLVEVIGKKFQSSVPKLVDYIVEKSKKHSAQRV